ncbi:extracellular solute-binding protein [Thiospirochaeta perfilievii]|uniref:Extracellular solute-binding protein n=1 Tax=Thiospirochaeta perfilievii TaxID=252967 RepID=A0A5C1QDY8_9SPIO|nr:extracellular solute-binding protein [Thiospirochaeta perfilievii]QEN04412.1 extracellular solute-binding protein [Thiospirochaeta perfilievii]
MKQLFLRLTSVLMFLMLATSMFANGNGEKSSTAATNLTADQAGWQVDTSPITFDWYLHFSWFPNQWGDDPTSRYITEKTGVDINFVVPAGSEAEKLNTLIAGDQLPDIITLGWWEAQITDMIDGEMVYPLDELAEKYDPYFFKVANPARLGWYTKEDGHIYGYPNASYTPSDYDKFEIPSNSVFIVRKDMYEALGSPSMRTPEGFLDTLKRAKEMFPEVNGNPLIPFAGEPFNEQGNNSFEKYLQNFLNIPQQIDGKLYDRTSHPEYKRWLKTFREANEMGLLSPDIFIDQRPQIEEKQEQGRYFSMLYQHTDMANQQMSLYQRDPNSIYIAVDGPANAKMDDPVLEGGGISGWTVTLISKNCEDPARAIRFLSYWMSEEGQHDFTLGAPGQWETVDGQDQLTKEAMDLMINDRSAYDKEYGGQQTYWMLMDNPMFEGKKWAPQPVTPMKELINWTKPYTASFAQFSNLTIPGYEPESVIGTKQQTMEGKYIPLLIIAESDKEFEDIWAEWQQKKEDINLQAMYDYQQPMYEANCEKLGVPVK